MHLFSLIRAISITSVKSKISGKTRNLRKYLDISSKFDKIMEMQGHTNMVRQMDRFFRNFVFLRELLKQKE